MKNRTITAILASVVLSLTACGPEQLHYTHLALNESHALAEGAQDSIRLRLDMDFPDPAQGNPVLADRMLHFIYPGILGENTLPDSPFHAVELWKNRILELYRNENLFIAQENPDQEFPQDWEQSIKGGEAFRYGDYLTYKVEFYDYAGGAHGNSGVNYYVFSLTDGRLITLAELVGQAHLHSVSDLLEKHIGNIPRFEERIQPGENFAVTEEGIRFLFNPYEIAPYSSGIIEILVPAGEMEPLLSPSVQLYRDRE